MDGAAKMATGTAGALPLPATKARGRSHPPTPAAAPAAQWRPTLSSLRGVAHDGPCCYGAPPWRCFSMRDGGRLPPSRAPATASSVRCSEHAMDLVNVHPSLLPSPLHSIWQIQFPHAPELAIAAASTTLIRLHWICLGQSAKQGRSAARSSSASAQDRVQEKHAGPRMYASKRQVQRVSFVQAKTRLYLGCALLVQRSKGKFSKKAQLMFIISSLGSSRSSLSAHLLKCKGDLSRCFCTAAELKFTFHFESILDTSGKNYARPNKNSNLTSCVDGCEPDWWCTADQPWWCYCRHRL